MKQFILAVLLLCPSIAFPQGAALSPVPKIQFLDNNGKPLANGFLYTYSAGTTTLLPTYTDASGTTQNTDPVRLDSGGFANIWLGNDSYRMVLQDSKGATIWTVDNVQNTGQIQIACAGTPNCFVKLDANGFVPQSNLNYIQGAAGSVNRTVLNRLQDSVSVKDFGAKGDGVTDDTAAFNAVLSLWTGGNGFTMHIPCGQYKLTGSLVIQPAQRFAMVGEGQCSQLIEYGNNMPIISTAGTSGFTNQFKITDLQLIYNTKQMPDTDPNSYAMYFPNNGAFTFQIERIFIDKARRGIVNDGQALFSFLISDIVCASNMTGACIYSHASAGQPNQQYRDIQATNANLANGIHDGQFDIQSTGATLSNIVSSSGVGTVMYLAGGPNIITNFHIESWTSGTDTRVIAVDNSQNIFNGISFAGSNTTTSLYALIKASSGGSNIDIINDVITNNTGTQPISIASSVGVVGYIELHGVSSVLGIASPPFSLDSTTQQSIAQYSNTNGASGTVLSTQMLRSGTNSNSDLHGRSTLSSGTAAFTFTGLYQTAPDCFATDVTTPTNNVTATATTTVLTLTGTGSDTVKWFCVAYN